MVGRCSLTVSKHMKATMVSALETRISSTAFNVCSQFQLAPLRCGGGNGAGQRCHLGGGGDGGRGLHSFTVQLNLSRV